MLASGLRGRAANLAPLAQMAGMLGVQRQDNLARSLDPVLGTDSRTTGEKLQSQLKGMDLNSPEGLTQAAKMLEGTDPVRAASLRQAAVAMQDEATKKLRDQKLYDLQVSGMEQSQKLQKDEFALRQAEWLDGMTTSAQNRDRYRLEMNRLKGLIGDEQMQRTQQAKATAARDVFRNDLATLYELTPATNELGKYIRSGLMSDAGLEALIVTKPTEWSYDTQQVMKNGKLVNMRVAIADNDPTNIVFMNPDPDQPEAPELPDIPDLSKSDIEDQYAPVIANNPTFLSLLEGEDNWFAEDKRPKLTVQAIADMMHNMRYGSGDQPLPLAAVDVALTAFAKDNPDAFLRGFTPTQYTRLAQQATGSGGTPPLNPTEQNRGTTANPDPLDLETLAKYPELRIVPVTQPAQGGQGGQGGQPARAMPSPQPIPAQPQAVPNPFNVGLNTQQPQAPDMRLGEPATGFDAAFMQRIQDAEQKVREGFYSPHRVNVLKKNYSDQLEKRATNLKQEITYLKGLKKYASPNKEARIAAVQAQLDDVNKKLSRYKVSD